MKIASLVADIFANTAVAENKVKYSTSNLLVKFVIVHHTNADTRARIIAVELTFICVCAQKH